MVAEVTLEELLIECVDALNYSGYDPEYRDEHLRYIKEVCADRKTPPTVVSLLKKTAAQFRSDAANGGAVRVLEENSQLENLVAALEVELGQRKTQVFAYHGTIFGRLKSITEEGLVPRRFPVWKDNEFSKEHLEEHVFFADSWRGAAWWADMTQSRSRGRREGPHRRPIVLRLPWARLKLEPDPLASTRGCLILEGSVPTSNADVILSPLHGFPKWQPIGTVEA